MVELVVRMLLAMAIPVAQAKPVQLLLPAAADSFTFNGVKMNAVTKSMEQKVNELKSVVHDLPQQPMHTEHFFLDGMYVRQIFIPVGTVFVGGKQKKSHFFMTLKGSAQVTLDDNIVTFRAGMVFKCEPGVQRAGVTLEDTVFVAVYRTDHTDLQALKDELVEEDPLSRYDAGNKVLPKELECKS
jgi:quercetin dioxygenase-like cupin family protein